MKFHRYKAIIASLLVFILFFSHAATTVASSTYDYDRNGNLAAANGWRYNWDYNNRLTDALLGTTTKVRYGYDPEGERTYYSNGADITIYANKYFNTETHVKTVFAQVHEHN